MAGAFNPYWTTAFGIPDKDAFKAATSDFWDACFPYDPFGLLKGSAEDLAAASPFSGLGLAASGYLTLHPYQSTDQSTAANAGINNAILGAQGASQEASVSQLIIPNCFQVTISMVAGGHAIENVIGVQNGGGTSPAAAAAVLAAWKVASGPLSKMSSLVQMTGVRAVDISSTNGAISTVSDTTLGSIVSTNSLSTRAACALIQWNGGTRSRSSRGRLYYGPIMETDIQADGATLASTSSTAFSTAMTNFRSSLSSSGYPLVVLSRVLSQAFSVTSHSVEPILATQRRRLR